MNLGFYQYTVKKEGNYLHIVGNYLLIFPKWTFSVVSNRPGVLIIAIIITLINLSALLSIFN